MTTRCYLAMTSAEISTARKLPPCPAWMACHFSVDSVGLSNFPGALPPDSMIILNDELPVHDHDPRIITEQLVTLEEKLKPKYFLLDLQRPGQPQTEKIVKAIAEAFGPRVGVSEHYAKDLQTPVFVSACPLRVPLHKYLEKWSGREIWLEAALEAETVTVDAKGSHIASAGLQVLPEPVFTHRALCCQYHTELLSDRVVFSVQRGKDALNALLEEAERLGVSLTVGLYQQLGA